MADRHYSRKTPGSPQFSPPGRVVVLMTGAADALWVSSWPLAEFTKHEWAGAWMCTLFRNESAERSSDLNTEAVAATRMAWGDPPRVPSRVGDVGMVSLIDRDKVRPVVRHGKPLWGYSWIKAGWEEIGETKSGLLALGLRPERMPPPRGTAGTLFALVEDDDEPGFDRERPDG